MTGQIELGLIVTGQAAVALLNNDVKLRLADNHLRGTNQTFYIMGSNPEDVLVWAGRGQRPRWVTQWLEGGGPLKQIAAILEEGQNSDWSRFHEHTNSDL